LGYTFPHETTGDTDGGILFGAHRLGSGVIHRDDFRGVVDFNGEVAPGAVFVEFGFDDIFFADKDNLNGKMTDRAQRSFDFSRGGVIATHGINRDGDHTVTALHEGGIAGRERGTAYGLLLGDFDDFASFVGTAVKADAVRERGFAALGALREAGRLEVIVGAAGAAPAFGMAAFWIRHGMAFPFSKIL
jgi:hypothetical protein